MPSASTRFLSARPFVMMRRYFIGSADVNESWKSFLLGRGASFAGDRPPHFGDPAAEVRAAATGTILAALTDHALIRAGGPDALAFLNGQLSNDVRRVDATRSELAAWCDARGRAVALFRVLRRGDDYLLLLPANMRQTILGRLGKFVLRARVALEAADELVCLGVSGAGADPLLRETLGEAPVPPGACRTNHDVTAVRLSGPGTRFLLVSPVAAATRLWGALRERATSVGPSAWNWLDIAAGLPQIYPETSEAFVPQTVNLELIGGVDFKKGCYPGQEIVARMQYLGRLKQRMYRAHAESDATPAPGTAIVAAGVPGPSAGTVVAAARAPEGGCDLLAVIQTGGAHERALRLGTENGPLLRLTPLPYEIPAGESV